MKFEKIIKRIKKTTNEYNYVILDTLDPMKAITWSAGGSIIMELLASEFSTIITFVIDTARNVNFVTFMFNMLYACFILYKTNLPFIIVMNKVIIYLFAYVYNMLFFTCFK